ncbi:MAG: formate dehydrogenase subunit alpha [Oscillospiraceae bacterium]|nr:formate dehydrogenase subunit alpha [Oscillospiraceae bacterium]
MSEKMLTVELDGISHQIPAGATILQAAQSVGLEIPTLCHLKDIDPIASCRMCLVEVEGMKPLVTACTQPCSDGMRVFTRSERVVEARRFVLDLLLSVHNRDCFNCAKNGICKLQQYCFEYGVEESQFDGCTRPNFPAPDESNPFLIRDLSKCVFCRRCVRTCDKLQGRQALSIQDRGFHSMATTSFNTPWNDTNCESCGNCAAACPTGALVTRDNKKGYRSWEVRRVRTTCPHCAVGCQMDLLVKNNRVVGAEPADGPSNRGLLCVKGRFASYKFIHADDRLRYPLVRKNGTLQRATWEEAISCVAENMKRIQAESGKDAVSGFSCSRATNEDNFVFQKMMRAAFGTNNVDNCARLCHSSSVHGLAITLGSGAMTNTIRDITAEPEVILLVGSNPTEAHPVVGAQLRQAAERGAKLIVVDPRRIDLVDQAEVFLQIRAGTNVAFSNGMIHICIRDGLLDEKFIAERTENFAELSEIVKAYTPEKTAEICGIDPAELVRAAHLYAQAEKAPIIYCLGVTEHSTGTEGVMSLSNLAMAVGKLGRSGCGVNPLRGQNNVQGACDMGCMPAQYPGYQKVTVPEVREKFEQAWGVPLPAEPGLTSTETFLGIEAGTVRGLYIFGEDPVVSDADITHVKHMLEKLDFLVVQDLFLTETAQFADVVLPAVSYAEKTGTFTNTERRVQMVRAAVQPEGEIKQDWDIFYDIMNAMGYPCEKKEPAAIMDEIASLTPSFGGISHERIETQGAPQWPCPTKEHPGTPILHVGKCSRGLGYFYPTEYKPSVELPDEEYPIKMVTGRMLYHYNAAAMTSRTEGINEICDSSYIEISRVDAQQMDISDGERIKVTSRRGEIETTARVGDKTRPGEVFMTFHFPDGNVNFLTSAALDAISRIYEYKVCAVQLAKLDKEGRSYAVQYRSACNPHYC